MRKALFTVALAAAIAVGCNQSERGGETTPPHQVAATETPRSETFTINAPVLSTTIKQGERQIVRLRVDRGSDFKQSVRLSAEVPSGLKAEFDKPTVTPADQEEVNVSVSADSTAALGDHRIKVIGTPETGSATNVDVKITVSEGASQ